MKIALAQINPVIADIAGNLKKITSCIDDASSQGADLVVFPEMAVIGYPPMDLLESRKLVQDNLDALDVIAKHTGDIGVVCGYVDIDRDHPPMLFNAAAFMYQKKIIARQFKSLLPTYDVFDELRYFSSEQQHNPVLFKGHSVGLTICEDIWNVHTLERPELIEGRCYDINPVDELIHKKIDVLINISSSPFIRGKFAAKRKMLSGIAKESRITVVYVNQVGGNDSLIFDGNSMIVAPSGSITGHAEGFKEGLFICNTDAGEDIVFNDCEIEDVRKALVVGLNDYVRKCGFEKVVLGLSGGIDSALTAALAVQALGPENVIGITMPSMYSSKGSIEDSLKLAKNLGIRCQTVPIRDLFNQYRKDLGVLFHGLKEDITEENIQARIRGNILMAMSNKTGALLLTTGNKSELAMGYCTLYGDMSGGLAVISDLPKTMVYELARHINRECKIIPNDSITKPPSAELRENQKDEDSLPPYSVLDRILELYIEEKKSVEDITTEGFNEGLVRDVLRKVNQNEYKRRQAAIGLKVTSKAFGIGRRIPMAQKFEP